MEITGQEGSERRERKNIIGRGKTKFKGCEVEKEQSGWEIEKKGEGEGLEETGKGQNKQNGYKGKLKSGFIEHTWLLWARDSECLWGRPRCLLPAEKLSQSLREAATGLRAWTQEILSGFLSQLCSLYALDLGKIV